MMMTWVQSSPVSEFHEVTWVAAGVDSGTEVARVGYAYVTIDGTQSQLDMTVMVDDGQETCGTESEIAVPAGTQVRVCYTMTNPFAFALVHHVLIDEHVGAFLIGFGPELGPGESFVRTDVAVIDETTTWIGYWRAQNEPDDEEDKVLYQDVDSVTIEVLEPDMPATTTTTTTTTVPCVAVTVPDGTTTLPVVTQPPTTTPVTTEPPPTTTTMPTSSSTTTTTTPSFTTTTSTTSPVLVSPTTPTTLGEPAGFAAAGHAGQHRVSMRQAVAPCPETPPGGRQGPGGGLPATGTAVPALALAAALVVGAGSVLLLMSRTGSSRRSPMPSRRR